MNLLGIIPARGGSKGVIRKNVREVAGRPLIAWTIEAALASRAFSRVIVSTDDAEIARVAAQWNAEVPFLRPAPLATDTAGSVEVVEHVLGEIGEPAGAVMLLQPTSPLRTASDISAAAAMLTTGVDAVVSVANAAHPPQWFCTIGADGTLVRFDDGAASRRQDLGDYYQFNGAIYLIRSEVLLRERTFTPRRTKAYVMPQERSLDIDTEWDFHLASLILAPQPVGEARND